MTEGDALLGANMAFYSAFSRGDADAMDAVWAEKAPVTCLHPGWDALIGHDAVLGSWRAILNGGPPPIRASHARAILYGAVGLVLCREHLGGATLVASNWFVIEGGRWRMVSHQAAPIARALEEGGDDGEDGDDDRDDERGVGDDEDDDDDGRGGPEDGAGGMVN